MTIQGGEEEEDRRGESHNRRFSAPSRASQAHSSVNSRDAIKLTTATAFSSKREYQVTT